MKSNHSHQRSIIIQLMFISLLLAGFLSAAPAYSDTIAIQQVGTTKNSQVSNYKTQTTVQNSLRIQNKPDRKKTLIDESRDLSAFFILGIIINIIMAVTFAWWFSREWRKTKK